MKKPLPLQPKTSDKLSTPNKYAYLTPREKAWLAGLMDGCGRIFNGRIMNTHKVERLITYKINLRASQLANPGIEKAGRLLRLPVRDYSKSGSGRLEIAIPNDCIDDLMQAIKSDLSADKYNAYVRAKYLSELSEFKLQGQVIIKQNGKLKQGYKGIDWGRVDELLAQPDVTDALRRQIAGAIDFTSSRIIEE